MNANAVEPAAASPPPGPRLPVGTSPSGVVVVDVVLVPSVVAVVTNVVLVVGRVVWVT